MTHTEIVNTMRNMDHKLEFSYDPMCGYQVRHNNKVVLECLSFEEIQDLSLKELMEIYASVGDEEQVADIIDYEEV